MLRIAIADDEPREREQLQEYVENYFSAQGKDIFILSYPDGASLIREAPKDLDILFLDIQMEEVDGIHAARRIREYDSEVLIIFITNMVQYAIEGYSVNALDFVLKPVDGEAVARELDKAVKRLKSKASPMISVRGVEGVFVMDAGKISYIETYDRRLLIHTAKGEAIRCNDTLQALEERLPGWFFRCHSAYLVNLRLVEKIAGSDIVVDGDRIPLSKHRKREFMQAMASYVKEIL